MDAEENDLYELHTHLERVVGAGPASTLMRHLSPTSWPDVATKADVAALRADLSAKLDLVAYKSDLEIGLARLESAMLNKLNQQTMTMIFALITTVVAIAAVALFR